MIFSGNLEFLPSLFLDLLQNIVDISSLTSLYIFSQFFGSFSLRLEKLLRVEKIICLKYQVDNIFDLKNGFPYILEHC